MSECIPFQLRFGVSIVDLPEGVLVPDDCCRTAIYEIRRVKAVCEHIYPKYFIRSFDEIEWKGHYMNSTQDPLLPEKTRIYIEMMRLPNKTSRQVGLRCIPGHK
jgi:hypothetical protein